MHRPTLDLSWFALTLDTRLLLLGAWCLGIWAMDHERHPLAMTAWRVQREMWAEEAARQVAAAPAQPDETDIMDAPGESGPADADEETHANMLLNGWPEAGPYRGHPPRVARYRIGPRPGDVVYAFGDWPAWEWL